MSHRADLAFDCERPSAAALLEKVLQAEATEGPSGSSVRLVVKGAILEAVVEAPDVATLRAAINSVARQADTALRTFAP